MVTIKDIELDSRLGSIKTLILLEKKYLLSFPSILRTKEIIYTSLLSHVEIPNRKAIKLAISSNMYKQIAESDDSYVKTAYGEIVENGLDNLLVLDINIQLGIDDLQTEELKGLSLSNIEILRVAHAIKSVHKIDVIIATIDKKLIKVAEKFDLKVLTNTKFKQAGLEARNKLEESRKFLSNPNLRDVDDEAEEEMIIAFIHISIFSSIVVLLVKYFRPDLVKHAFFTFINTISVWGTIFVIIVAGIVVFVFREKRRLTYGIIETLFGILGIVYIFYQSNFDLRLIKLDTDLYFKIFGGIYIIVRGLDNIVRSLKDTKLGLKLKYRFGIG